jgi:site-specific recombinase XerD
MAEFTVWKDRTAAGSFRVRHIDPKISKIPVTDYVVKKDERMVIDGKERTALYIAEYYVGIVRDRYRRGTMGIPDPSLLQENLQTLIDQYLEENKNLGWKTISHYANSLKFLCIDNSISTLGALLGLDFKVYVEEMQTRKRKNPQLVGLANTTIRNRLVDIAMFCAWLVKQKKIQKSPVPEGLAPPVTKARPRFYTDDEFAALEKEIKRINKYAHIGCRLAHDYGLRRVEITGDGKERMEGVLWEDIIWHPDGRADLFLRPEVTKGGTGSRKLRLAPEFLKLIGPKKSGPIVPLTYDAFWRYFKRARRDSKVNKKLTLHGQRHTFGKDFLQKTGSNQAALRDLMGHKDVKTTEIYSQFEQSYLDDTMEKLHKARKNGAPVVVRR